MNKMNQTSTGQKAFILIGRSGCGKGTQAKLLMELLGKTGKAIYLQNGAEFRNFIKGDSATAKLSADAYAHGVLQPEFLAVHMWSGALVREYHGTEHLVLDGMPRKFHEAGVLDSMFDFYKIEKPIVIHIDVSSEWSTARLLGRGRQDDTRGDVASRMKWYETDVVPAIDFYRKNPKYQFFSVNGERAVEEVFADIVKQAHL
jgi:adenylate kinase family enzyme